MSINQIELLNGFNYHKWRGDIELNLAILEFDHVLKNDPPTEPAATASKDVKEKYLNWMRHNKMALICIKKSMNSSVMGSIPDSEYAKEYMHSIAEKYKVSNKAKTGRLMNKLTGLKYNGGSIREYIMKGVDIAEKLKGMKMNIEEPFLVFLLLNSFPEEYSHLKSLYNTQKEKWSVNELISICVQEEEDRAKKGKEVDINYISKPKNKKHFPNKDGASSSGIKHDLNKGKPHKSGGPMKCFFCKKTGHFKKDCDGFKNWLKKKGTFLLKAVFFFRVSCMCQ